MIGESCYFYYDGTHSKDMGLISVHVGTSGMYEDPFFGERRIEETEIRGTDKPYFHGISEAPLIFKLQLAFENEYDDQHIRKVARWLKQDSYKEFYFEESSHIRFFAVVVENTKLIHNGLKQGYLEVTFRTNCSHGYSPEYVSEVFDFTDNPLIYEEKSASDFEDNEMMSDLKITEEESLELQKEGIDFSKSINTDEDWNLEGEFNNTRVSDGELELGYRVAPGTDFSKNDSTKEDWENPNAILNNVDVATIFPETENEPDYEDEPDNEIEPENGQDCLVLAKEGSDIEKRVGTTPSWEEGSHFNTVAEDDKLKLDFEVPSGEDYLNTEDSQTEWEQGTLTDLDTRSSPGELKLAKEGADYSNAVISTNGWSSGTHKNTRAIDNHLELDWDMPPGQDVNQSNTTDSDWKNGVMNGLTSKNGTLQLAKEGTDFNRFDTSNADFNGTHSGTVASGNSIKLVDNGSNYSTSVSTQTGFNAGTLSSVVSGGGNSGYVELSGLPKWEMESDLSDFRKHFSTPDDAVFQRDGYVDIDVKKKRPYNDDNGIKVKNKVVSYPLTCEFRAKISGNTHIYMSDMPPKGKKGNEVKIFGLPRSSSWAWYRVILTKTGCKIYQNGKRVYPDKVSTGTTTTWTNRLTLYVDNGNIGRFQIDHFYMRSGVDLGAPPSNGLYSGTWTSPTYDISGVGVVQKSNLSYSWTKSGVGGTPQNVILEARVQKNGTWGSWTQVTGNTIPGVAVGEDLRSKNARLQIRANIQSYDSGYTPRFRSFSFNIDSISYTQGTYTSPVIDISGVVKSSASNISWAWNSNKSGSITGWVRIGTDNGGSISWGSWQQATSKGAIPSILLGTDLKNKRMQYKFDLSTSDPTVTPELFDVTLSITTAYKPSGSRTSHPIDVRSVQEVVSSNIGWDSFGNATVFVRVETNNGWQPWVKCDSKNPLPYFSAGSDVRNYLNMEYRIDMVTTNISKTPTLSNFSFSIQATNGRRFTFGSRESGSLNISQVGKSSSTLFAWEATVPNGTSVIAEVDVSLDGGVTWLGYQEVSNGGKIPHFAQTTDLSNARMKYRFTLTAQPNSTVTPRVSRADMVVYSGYKPSGQRVSPVLDISQVKELETSILYWMDNVPESTSVLVETRYSVNGGTSWSPWSPIEKDGSIYGLSPSTSLLQGRLQHRITLSTSDTSFSPSIDYISVSIEATQGEYYTSGYREEIIDLSPVSKASSAELYWGMSLMERTTVEVSTSLSMDGGSTWSPFQAVGEDGVIPQISQNTDLKNAKLKIRFTLSTSDIYVTPAVTDYLLLITSGYKPEGSRTSQVFDIGDTKLADFSFIDWDADIPLNTSLLIEKRVGEDKDGNISWEPWRVINKGDRIIEDGALTINKKMQYRLTMFSNNTLLSPIVKSVDLGITATKGERHSAGYYITNPIDISSVVRAGKTESYWSKLVPPNTSYKIESRLSLENKAVSKKNMVSYPDMNQDFDNDGVVDHWDTEIAGAGASTVSAVYSYDKANSAQKITILSNPDGAAFCSVNQKIEVKPSTVYSLSFDVMGENTVGRFRGSLILDWYDKNNKLIEFESLSIDLTDSFQRIKFEGKLSPSNAKYAIIKLRASGLNAGDTGSIWYRRVQFEENSIATTYTNGEYAWSQWQTIKEDGSISGIDQSTNLSEGLLQLRISLNTDDVFSTPKISDLNIGLTTGYKPSGVRQSKEIDLYSVNLAYGSQIIWDGYEPDDTEIIIETSINGGQTWERATNGGPVPSIRDQSDIKLETLLIRETLVTSETLATPRLKSIKVRIDEGLTIYNQGDTELTPEMWIEKDGDGDIQLIHRHTGEVFSFVDLKDKEMVYVDNEVEHIETDLPGVYRYDNFNDNFLNLQRGRNDFQVVGNFKLQLRYRYKLL